MRINDKDKTIGDGRFLRLPEAADRLGIKPRTLRTWARERLIPSYTPTKRILLFREGEILDAVARFRRA